MIDTNIGARFSTFLPNNLTLRAGQGVSPKEQLAYLSQVLGFTVTYNDFPKKGEYLSLVSLSTTPPQVSSLLNLHFECVLCMSGCAIGFSHPHAKYIASRYLVLESSAN